MLKSLHLQNFRGFRETRISPLQRINLITGENGTGKTGVLEALYLLLLRDPGQLGLGRFSSAFRSSHENPGDDFRSFWEWLFFQKNMDLTPRILGEESKDREIFADMTFSQPNGVRIRLGIQHLPQRIVNVEGVFKVGPGGYGGSNLNGPNVLVQSTWLGQPVNDAELYNRVSLTAGGEERIIELMRVVEPRLKKLRYSKITSQPLVYADLGLQHFLPATQMGQGFSRLLTLFCEMMVSQAKVLLIDEIENGLHYSVLGEIWKGIGALAEKEDIQVFATTHSWGCIVAAHEAFAAMPKYNFALHRLQRVKGEVEAVTYDREMLETSVRTELEVR
jgi:hypothetical protein